MDDMGELGSVCWDRLDCSGWDPALEWCLRVFLRGFRVSMAESLGVCGDQVLAALLDQGLLRPAKDNPSDLVCPVWLYPVDGFVVASDRCDNPEGGPVEAARDVVFPAIYGGTLRFLQLLPAARGGVALDLCGGSGIGALHLARSARQAVTADVTGRSAAFAAFNARLNCPMDSISTLSPRSSRP